VQTWGIGRELYSALFPALFFPVRCLAVPAKRAVSCLVFSCPLSCGSGKKAVKYE